MISERCCPHDRIATDHPSFNDTAAATSDLISHTGPRNASNYLLNGHNVKPDLSAGTQATWQVEKGKKYLFRIVNSAAHNAWSMHFDHHKMTVIGTSFL